MKEKWNELKKYPLLVLFFVFLFGFMFLDMAWPKREYSDLERRDLAQVPEFSLTKLFENVWTSEYDTYTKDQVVGRDMWLRLQSRSEKPRVPEGGDRRCTAGRRRDALHPDAGPQAH